MTRIPNPDRADLARILHTGPAGHWKLADAILADFIVIPRADLPEVKDVKHDRHAFRVDGQTLCFTSAENARQWVIRDIAVWQHLEARDSADKAAREARRDIVARELLPDAASRDRILPYADQPLLTQRAIDRIIELEEAAA